MPCSKESALELLLSAHRAGRLAHAHLFTGSPGCGKGWLAEHLAAEILGCEARSVLAHPDAHFVQPESKSRRIVIDQIRSLELMVRRKPLVARAKVVILHDADRLQPAAANAFLKTLEEPPEQSVLLLTSQLPEAILETVLSRCVETSLRGGDSGPGEEGGRVIEALAACLLAPGGPTVGGAFQFVRKFQEILSAIRTRVSDEYGATLKQESARYKNATGGTDWLEEREEQLKALAESTALRERERLLGAMLYAFGGALRAASGGDPGHPVCAKLAESFPPAELFARIDSLQVMRRRLAMNVNEPLALEAGMLEIALGDHRSRS